MPYIKVIEADSASSPLAKIYRTIEKEHGHLSNIWRLASLEPELIRTHFELHLAVMHASNGLTELEREIIALTVAVANECPYCQHDHSNAFLRAGGGKDLLEAICEGEEPDTESKRIRRIIYFARKLTLLPNSMTRRDTEDLRLAGLNDQEILQTVEITSYCNYTTRLAMSLGAEIENQRE